VIVTDCPLEADGTDLPVRKMMQTTATEVRSLSGRNHTESRQELLMDDEIRIQDLTTDVIRERLLEEGSELNEQQAVALKQFIEDIGGPENALATIAVLDRLEEVA